MGNLKRLWVYFKPYKWLILLSVVASIFVAATSGATAYIVKPTLDKIFINENRTGLVLMPFIIVIIYFIRGIFRFVQTFSLKYIGQRVIQSLRNDLYIKIVKLPLKFFNENSTGILMSRITNDVNMMQSSIPAFVNIIRDSFTIIGLACVVIYQDYKMAISAFVVLPFIGFIIVKVGRKAKKYTKKGQERMGDLNSALQETFTGVRVVKSFVAEGKEIEKFEGHNERFAKYQIKKAFVSALSSPFLEMIGALGLAVIIYYGGLKVINGESTPGTFFSFMTALIMMYEPFKKINESNQKIQSAIGAADRVYDVLDTHNEILSKDGFMKCDARNKNISFNNVSFKYSENDEFVLKNINIEFPFCTTNALVGASGAGKSTFVNLIPRFYDVSEGSIKIGDVDIRDFKVYSLRRNIGIVSQDPFLFNDTVSNNIAYASDNVSQQEIINAAKAAFAHDFISELPEGYETIIGERGVRLSGGQKQRITIARAILMNPPILILDEATSALDTESEKIVQKALENLMQDRTSFVIAHRLSTVINADKIIVLDKGKIVGTGKHSELLETSEIYQTLYRMQFKDNET
ncbi:MAG: ATP-binding cassette domain-containing protein [Flexistipes sinusarabici]|uniref:ATP-binding cassette domain-containing protein n=1 Tax=Flexistipes sinusarabici TaxID=2352 RepID=A0A5D0MNF8_FLESI|nr:ABC transporter transmembrane domain-containing protein [Flexistipes sinusarabici]TYB33932.1 MAG: ATP-binding cassette domain-containing protein [Flexistipes sinusarabici]